MTQVSCKTPIHIPADVIWQVISDFAAAGQYLSGVITWTVEGNGVGALRTPTSADGSAVVEQLETLDKAAHRLSYTLLTDTPFHNCRTTVRVYTLAPNESEVEWSATFEPAGIPASEAAEILESALKANCLALKHFIER